MSMQMCLELVRTNCELLSYQRGQFFNVNFNIQQRLQPSYDDQVKVKRNDIATLHQYLEEINRIIKRIFCSAFTAPNQYSYLQSCWQKHHERYSQQQESPASDRIDSLNQVISKLKYRSRQLFLKEIQQNKRYWSNNLLASQKNQEWDHPFFEIMNSRITMLSMQNNEYEHKLYALKCQAVDLLSKNKEIESKYSSCKEKNKKMQGKMFEMAKKKAELEKQLFQKVYSKASVRENKIVNKQNINGNSVTKFSEFVPLLQEQCQPRQHQQNNPMGQSGLQYDSNKIQQKYRNAKLVSRRSISNISLNSSFDSAKSIRFERTGGKKLLIKQKE